MDITLTLDNRFTITAWMWQDSWRWGVTDEVGCWGYIAPEPAKDQTTVLLLAAEVIKERY